MQAIGRVVILALLLSSCNYATSTTYRASEVGRPIETEQARVISARIVRIAGEANAVGPLAGGAVAATTTGAFTRGRNAGLLALLAGLVGAGAGYVAQAQLSNREGIEYVLEVPDGRTITLVQNRARNEPPIAAGTPILIQGSGRYARVIVDPTYAPPAPAPAPAPSPSGGAPSAALPAPAHLPAAA